MRLYKRQDFLKLPAMTIYSKKPTYHELCEGLFCKLSDSKEYKNDFVEQDLISECGYPDDITCGADALDFQMDLRDSFKDFRTDLDCSGRNGMFDDEDVFIVWDKEDITKLRDFLNKVLE